MRTPIVFALAVAALLGPLPMALGQSPPGTGVQYQLVIDCPGVAAANGGSPAATCPEQAVDPQDQMGDPTIAVDPLKPSDLIIGSLHGGSSCNNAPSIKSRCGQEFTTFTSTDHGASWFDSPYVPPSDIGGNAFGQTTGLTIDPYGHVYVGSLYAVPQDNQGQRFNYTIAAQKFASIQTIQEQQDGAYNAEYIKPVFDGNAIHQTWFLFNPATDNMTMVWNEQVTPYSTGQVGGGSGNGTGSQPSSSSTSSSRPASNSTSSTSHSSTGTTTSSSGTTTSSSSPTSTSSGPFAGAHLPSLGRLTASIGLFGLGGARQQPAPAAPPRLPADGKAHGVIGVVWTNSSLHSSYHYQPQKWVIGPCRTSTNPVLSEGYLYVGCVADTKDLPFPWDPKAADGTVEMFRMDPNGGQPHWLGGVPILGGQPKLGVRSDGRLSLVSAQATKDGGLDLWTVFGRYDGKSGGIEWSKLTNYGAKVDRLDPATKIVDAQVQSVIYREYSGVIQFILKERVQPQGVGLTTVQTTVGPHLRKTLVAIDEGYGVLAKFNLDIGNPLNRTDPTLLQADEMAYDDLTDSFLQLPEAPYSYQGKSLGDLYAREFFAVGDYGIVQFAEVIELTTLRGPQFQPPPPPPPPNPAPAASSQVAGSVVPVTGLTMVGALSLSMIATKRKQAALLRAKK